MMRCDATTSALVARLRTEAELCSAPVGPVWEPVMRSLRELFTASASLIEQQAAELARLRSDAELRDYEDSSVGEALAVLFQALGWTSGGLASAAIEVVQQRDAAHARIAALEEERDETLMLAEHPDISNLRDLARELVYRAQRILTLEEALREAVMHLTSHTINVDAVEFERRRPGSNLYVADLLNAALLPSQAQGEEAL